jgi:hypothetical protein
MPRAMTSRSSQPGKPDFNLVEPGRIGGREVELYVGMSLQELLDFGAIMLEAFFGFKKTPFGDSPDPKQLMRRGWLRRSRLILPPAPIRLCGGVWLPLLAY